MKCSPSQQCREVELLLARHVSHWRLATRRPLFRDSALDYKSGSTETVRTRGIHPLNHSYDGSPLGTDCRRGSTRPGWLFITPLSGKYVNAFFVKFDFSMFISCVNQVSVVSLQDTPSFIAPTCPFLVRSSYSKSNLNFQKTSACLTALAP